MFNKLTVAILVLALAALACGLPTSFNLPTPQPAGPDITDKISVKAPDGAASLTLAFGAGKLTLNPGATNFVDGTATYNVRDFKPEIKTDGGKVSITQGNYKLNSLPNLNNFKNEWDLKMGKTPMDLTINAGAYEGHYDFGGLALTNLTISDGASEVTANFSAPNPEKMNFLTYKTGASNVTLTNISNANFANMTFESGAGNYKLDFGGKLQRDASVTVRSGVSNLTLVIPSGLAVTVKMSGGLSNVQFPSGWSQNGDLYTQSGSGPALTISIEMGAGNVQIVQ